MKGQTRIVIDGYTRFCLTAIMVLLTLLVVGLWSDGPALTGPAEAAPKRGAAKVPLVSSSAIGQRDKLVTAAEATNRKLDKVVQVLESGKLTVVVGNLEDLAGEKPAKPNK